MDPISFGGAFLADFPRAGLDQASGATLDTTHDGCTQDRLDSSARTLGPSLSDVFEGKGLFDHDSSLNVGTGSDMVAMAFPPTLGQAEASDIASDAVNHSLLKGRGKVDLQGVRAAVNREFVRRDAGSMNLEVHPDPKPDDPTRTVLRSRDNLIRIYESGTHGGRGDGGVRIEVRPGGRNQRNAIEMRLRYDSRTQTVMRSLPEWNSKEVPYVPTSIRNSDDTQLSE